MIIVTRDYFFKKTRSVIYKFIYRSVCMNPWEILYAILLIKQMDILKRKIEINASFLLPQTKAKRY